MASTPKVDAEYWLNLKQAIDKVKPANLKGIYPIFAYNALALCGKTSLAGDFKFIFQAALLAYFQ